MQLIEVPGRRSSKLDEKDGARLKVGRATFGSRRVDGAEGISTKQGSFRGQELNVFKKSPVLYSSSKTARVESHVVEAGRSR